MKTISFSKVLVAGLAFLGSIAVQAATVYLNYENIDVSVGDGTSAGTFHNTFNSGQTIEKAIDASSADAEEFHNQTQIKGSEYLKKLL